MKKGLYITDKIVDVSNVAFEVHEDFKWIDVPDNCTAGWDVINGQAIEPTAKTLDQKLEELRFMRDTKLRKTDWVSGEDVPQSLKDLWFPYRQALRDITKQYQSLDTVVWPQKPL